jgi:membrane protein implicated in regulation of membrane protease activity
MNSVLFVVLGVVFLLALLVGALFAVVWFAGSAGRRAQGH